LFKIGETEFDRKHIVKEHDVKRHEKEIFRGNLLKNSKLRKTRP